MKGKCYMKSTRSPLLSVLFVSFLFFPCSSAEAAIRAAFENPGDAQPVAGITTISGWTFDTETGSHISRVTLLIDETLRRDIPCCAERGDVPLAFPAVPAEQTLNSGWGMTFNWGLLSAGIHTLKVEIESTSGQIFSTQTRTVTVVKPGEFEFLDSFDLSAAEPSILGNQLVLKGVEVRDKTSKQTKTVNVRFQWFENSQSLGATGSVTADGSGEPRFVFGDQVSQEDQSRMREATEIAMYYIQEETGVWINDYTVYAFVDRENFLDVYIDETAWSEKDRAELRERVLANGDVWGEVHTGSRIFLYGYFKYTSLLGIMAHDYFHVIQHYRLSEARFETDPPWLIEGSAVYAEVRTGVHEGLFSFAQSKAWHMDGARKTAAPLQSLETYEDMFAVGADISYHLGFMAVDFLVENFGDLPALPALVSFYEEIGPGTTWQAAFRSAFGISIREFYAAFEAYRLEHFPPLP